MLAGYARTALGAACGGTVAALLCITAPAGRRVVFGGFAKTTNIPALCAAFPDFGVMADVAAGLASAAPFSGRTVSASS